MSQIIGQLVDDADHIRLERLATEVNWRVDWSVAETLPELFTEDGMLATFGEPAIGHAAIRSWGRIMDTEKPLGRLRHVLTNFRFTIDGSDGATGTFHVTAYVAGGPAGQDTLPIVMGVCTDRYVRVADGWKVRSRQFEPHVMR